MNEETRHSVPLPADGQIIHAYGDGGFRLAGGLFHAGSLLLLPDAVRGWPPASVADVDGAAVDGIAAARQGFDLVLIGTGATMRPLPVEARARLRALDLAFEVMGTGAACRTFNVLIAEGRRVAAALIAVP